VAKARWVVLPHVYYICDNCKIPQTSRKRDILPSRCANCNTEISIDPDHNEIPKLPDLKEIAHVQAMTTVQKLSAHSNVLKDKENVIDNSNLPFPAAMREEPKAKPKPAPSVEAEQPAQLLNTSQIVAELPEKQKQKLGTGTAEETDYFDPTLLEERKRRYPELYGLARSH
jgi:hypothetical protein